MKRVSGFFIGHPVIALVTLLACFLYSAWRTFHSWTGSRLDWAAAICGVIVAIVIEVKRATQQ